LLPDATIWDNRKESQAMSGRGRVGQQGFVRMGSASSPDEPDQRRTTMSQRIRIGIVGAGQIARQSHLPAALACDGAEVTALVDPVTARCEEMAREYGLRPKIAADVKSVLGDIDAAIIATPNHTHAPIAVACLEAGVATLIEKPLAQSHAEGRRIAEAAAKTGAALAVGYCLRYRENVFLLKELLDNGYFGRVRRFVHQAGTVGGWAPVSGYNLDRSATGGGVLVVTGSHFIDRMLYLWGMPGGVEFTDDSEGGPEANCRGRFVFARPGGDIEGWVIYSKTVFLPAMLLIETDRGVVVAADADNADIVFRPHGEDGVEQIVRRRDGSNAQDNVFRLQIEDFVAAIRERRTPFVDGAQGLASLDLIEQMYAARRPMRDAWYDTVTTREAAA